MMAITFGIRPRLSATLAALLGVAAALAASPASAQSDLPAADAGSVSAAQRTPDRQEQDTVVVVGRRPDKRTVERLARSVTRDLSSDAPVARFFRPVCFAVTGLARGHLEVMGQRMAEVAREAGVELAGDGCRPNILVQFVENGAAEMTQLRARDPKMFDGMEPSDIRKAIREPGPAHAWSITGLRNSDGMTGPVREAGFLVLTMRRDMFSSFVLIDRDAAIGRTLTQLADYAAMRALARVRSNGAGDGDTILRLFAVAPSDAPPGLTAFDRAYLKALYVGPGNLRSATKMHQVARLLHDGDIDPAVEKSGDAPSASTRTGIAGD